MLFFADHHRQDEREYHDDIFAKDVGVLERGNDSAFDFGEGVGIEPCVCRERAEKVLIKPVKRNDDAGRNERIDATAHERGRAERVFDDEIRHHEADEYAHLFKTRSVDRIDTAEENEDHEGDRREIRELQAEDTSAADELQKERHVDEAHREDEVHRFQKRKHEKNENDRRLGGVQNENEYEQKDEKGGNANGFDENGESAEEQAQHQGGVEDTARLDLCRLRDAVHLKAEEIKENEAGGLAFIQESRDALFGKEHENTEQAYDDADDERFVGIFHDDVERIELQKLNDDHAKAIGKADQPKIIDVHGEEALKKSTDPRQTKALLVNFCDAVLGALEGVFFHIAEKSAELRQEKRGAKAVR